MNNYKFVYILSIGKKSYLNENTVRYISFCVIYKSNISFN